MDYFSAICWFVPLTIVALFGLTSLMKAYNKLVVLRERVEQAWHDMGVQLNRRHDLLSNLLGVAERYGIAESSELERIAKARYAAMGQMPMEARGDAERALRDNLSRLFVVMEAYPNVKGDRHYATLLAEWKDTEDKIAFSRSSYNQCVFGYNSALSQFPQLLVGAMFSLSEANYFQPEEKQKVAIRNAPSI